ncbi:NADH dehydrogenase [ubiquinone] 1 alpha subcomplex subunit 5 [Neocloeon triangulifer]|uniref:NADH dehydrogenase [ubiquinone] 1 alpha subcomplex subunit 5 n=1 Tax=Neocloeon triangulifer TaxID=2078957 RepID=UPI00286F1964|nr:NADH dehydrogenase [ubiquinone] 1 alpha subcomplex subunit 5 [Neocloeon triangulifer]
MASGATKKLTTKLTGLAVAKHPHHTLSVLYNKIQRALQQMPEQAAYRKHTSEVIDARFKLVNEIKDVDQLEQKIGCGQIEEVIVQAENELVLARKMLGWKPWEPLLRAAPEGQWQWPPTKP